MAFQEAINTHPHPHPISISNHHLDKTTDNIPHSISISNPHLDKTDSTDTTDITDNQDINWTSGDFITSEQYYLVKNLKPGAKVKKKAVARVPIFNFIFGEFQKITNS